MSTTTTNWKNFPSTGLGGKRLAVKSPPLKPVPYPHGKVERLNAKLYAKQVDAAEAHRGKSIPRPIHLVRVKPCKCAEGECHHTQPPKGKFGASWDTLSAFKAWVHSTSEHLPHPVFNRAEWLSYAYDKRTNLRVPCADLCPKCGYVECKCQWIDRVLMALMPTPCGRYIAR